MADKKYGERFNEKEWEALMTLAQAGDARAYEQLLREVGTYLQFLLRRKVPEESQRDDLCQDIILSIHKARHTYDTARPLMPWLQALIRFRLNDHLRKIYKDKNIEELNLDRDYHETYLDPATNEEIDASILEALDKLPAKQKRVVELLKIEGMSVKEAAKTTGMSESALKVSAHRAYKALKQLLTGIGGPL